MRKFAAVAALSAPLLLGACAGQQQSAPGEFGMNKTTGGGLLGAVGGAVAGAQFGQGKGQLATTAIGTLLGAFVGSQVGSSLDKADVAYANRAGQQAFETAPTGHQVAWSNPDSGHMGTVTPVRTYQQASGQYCREYQQTVTIGGKKESSFGTACRQPDGSWQIQN